MKTLKFFGVSIFVVLISVFMFGCASLTKEGRMVREFSGTPPPSCKFLGAVVGSSASAFGGSPHNNAHTDMMNQTGKLGGNYVRTLNTSTGLVWHLGGDAYDCPQDLQLVYIEPTPEQQMAQQMRRQNDIAEQQQRNQFLRDFKIPRMEQPYQIPVREAPARRTTNCYPGVGGSIHCTSN